MSELLCGSVDVTSETSGLMYSRSANLT